MRKSELAFPPSKDVAVGGKVDSAICIKLKGGFWDHGSRTCDVVQLIQKCRREGPGSVHPNQFQCQVTVAFYACIRSSKNERNLQTSFGK